MREPPEEVFSVLREYVDVHDEIFGGSWIRTLRKMIPIPGVFLAVDYGDCASRLDPLVSELEKQDARAWAAVQAEEGEPQRTVHQYIKALLETVKQLRSICLGLARKSQGSEYSSTEYTRALSQYDQLVAAYTSIGDELNRLRAEKPEISFSQPSEETLARFGEWRVSTPSSGTSQRSGETGPTRAESGMPGQGSTGHSQTTDEAADSEGKDVSREPGMTPFDEWTAELCSYLYHAAKDSRSRFRSSVRTAMMDTLKMALSGTLSVREFLAAHQNSGRDGAKVVEVTEALAEELEGELWGALQRTAHDSGVSTSTALADAVIKLVEADRPSPSAGALHPGHFAVTIDYAAALMLHLADIAPDRARSLLNDSPSTAGSPVTRLEALTTARNHLENTGRGGLTVSRLCSVEEIDTRRPSVYGHDLHSCWIAYVERPQPEGSFIIGASHILLVSKETGEVVYDGPANDEG